MSKSLSILYARWAELRAQAKQDCSAINQTDLRKKDFNLADHHIKWLNHMYDWKEKYIKLEKMRKELYRELFEFYRDEYPHRLDRKEDLQLFIESDERYSMLNEKVQIIKGIITYSEGVCDKLKQKQWEIKAFIDYVTFMEGRV